MTRCWAGTIYGEPASKANSRRIVTNRRTGRPMSIKSSKACAYADAVKVQTPVLDPLMTGDLRINVTLYYASRRPDLDESVLLDALQGRIFMNDRQIREKHVCHRIDRASPRAVIEVEQIEIEEIAGERDKPINRNPLPGRLP